MEAMRGVRLNRFIKCWVANASRLVSNDRASGRHRAEVGSAVGRRST